MLQIAAKFRQLQSIFVKLQFLWEIKIIFSDVMNVIIYNKY